MKIAQTIGVGMLVLAAGVALAEKRIVINPGPISPSGKPVNERTPLQVGQAIQVEQSGHWWAAQVLELGTDGGVKVRYIGWGSTYDEHVTRARLQLDPSARIDAALTLPAGFVEARLTDGGTMRLQLVEKSVQLTSPYGKLTIPAGDIERIEFATRISEDVAKRVETAIKNLASPEFEEREAASASLLALREKAYPGLLASQKGATDLEVKCRIENLLAKLRESVGEELLVARPDDVVHTSHSRIAGRIAAQSFKVKTAQFGDQELKLTDMLSLRAGKASEPQETPRK